MQYPVCRIGQASGEPNSGFSSASQVHPGSKIACIPTLPSAILMIEMPPRSFMSSLWSGVSNRRVSITFTCIFTLRCIQLVSVRDNRLLKLRSDSLASLMGS